MLLELSINSLSFSLSLLCNAFWKSSNLFIYSPSDKIYFLKDGVIASIFLAQNSFKNFVLIYDTSADTIVINIEMPTGTTKEVTTESIAKIEDAVSRVVKPEELVALYSLVGKQVDQEVVSEEKGSLADGLFSSCCRKR